MADYLPPLEILPIFDSNLFNIPSITLNFNELIALYATFPISSSNQVLNKTITNGTFTWSGTPIIIIKNVATITFNTVTLLTELKSNSLLNITSNSLLVLKNTSMSGLVYGGPTTPGILGSATTGIVVAGVSTYKPVGGTFNLGTTSCTLLSGYGGGLVDKQPTPVTGAFDATNVLMSSTGVNWLQTGLGSSALQNINANIIDGSLVNNQVLYDYVLAKASVRGSNTLGGSLNFLGNVNYNCNITLSKMDLTVAYQINIVFSQPLLATNYIVTSSCALSSVTLNPYIFNKTVNGFSMIPYFSISSILSPQYILSGWWDFMIYNNT